MSKITVNEGSTSYHPLTITDADGGAVTPESLRYRIMASDADQITDWTTIPTNATQIVVSATENTIIASGQNCRFITVEATHNGGEKITADIDYTLVNLKGI